MTQSGWPGGTIRVTVSAPPRLSPARLARRSLTEVPVRDRVTVTLNVKMLTTVTGVTGKVAETPNVFRACSDFDCTVRGAPFPTPHLKGAGFSSRRPGYSLQG